MNEVVEIILKRCYVDAFVVVVRLEVHSCGIVDPLWELFVLLFRQTILKGNESGSGHVVAGRVLAKKGPPIAINFDHF